MYSVLAFLILKWELLDFVLNIFIFTRMSQPKSHEDPPRVTVVY